MPVTHKQLTEHSVVLQQCKSQENVLYFVYQNINKTIPRKGTGPCWKINANSWSKIVDHPAVMQSCLIPTSPSLNTGCSLARFLRDLMEEGMLLQLLVEVELPNHSGCIYLEQRHSIQKQSLEDTLSGVMADSNLQTSVLSLIRQLSAHTRLKQFSETSVFTYKAGREGGLVGTFSLWLESSNKPLMSVVKKDVEKYRSSRGSMYSADRIHELSP
jgi:hypothetical protein